MSINNKSLTNADRRRSENFANQTFKGIWTEQGTTRAT